MKKFLRITALIMALLTLSGTIVACADTGSTDETTASVAATEAPTVETTVEETLYALDDLAESYNFNEVVTLYMWSNYTMMEFYAEETGDVIDDAIFNRNIAVDDRLGITFEYVEAFASVTLLRRKETFKNKFCRR